MKNTFTFITLIFLIPLCARSTIWNVGSTRQYTKPSQVSGLVQDGDTVEIDEGTYRNDVARWTKNNLLLRGAEGGAHLNAEQKAYGRKAIWVISGNNITVENIEFSNCRDPLGTDKNWAGIRQEGMGVTVRNCYFHNNDNGILGGGGSESELVIEYCEFAYNGFGDGYSHNLYIGNVKSLTFSFNYSHHAKVGHELKSRAMRNYILYNRIGNESDGTASREIDLPNGGLAIIIGNQIQQGINTSNSGMIGYGLEGLSNPVSHKLYLINNTIVNDIKGRGQFINIKTGTELYYAWNNIFAGYGELLSGSANATETMNNKAFSDIAAAGFVDSKEYNYHLLPSSSAVDNGTDPGKTAEGYDLTPVYEYVHPKSRKARVITDVIDAGAYEYNPLVNSNRNIMKSSSTYSNVNAYPNPYNKRVQFQIESKVSGNGVLTIYNLSGEKLKTIYEGYLLADEEHIVDFVVPDFCRTNLVYVFNINGSQCSGKLIYLR